MLQVGPLVLQEELCKRRTRCQVCRVFMSKGDKRLKITIMGLIMRFRNGGSSSQRVIYMHPGCLGVKRREAFYLCVMCRKRTMLLATDQRPMCKECQDATARECDRCKAQTQHWRLGSQDEIICSFCEDFGGIETVHGQRQRERREQIITEQLFSTLKKVEAGQLDLDSAD